MAKELVWIGSSLADLKAMPDEVQQEVGFALDRVQRGLPHLSIKPLSGLPGVQEIRADFDHATYRTVYVVNLADAIYVLHAFQKKSKKGIATPKKEMDLIRVRLRLAREQSDEQRTTQ